MTPEQVKQQLQTQGHNNIIIHDYVECCLTGSGQGAAYFQSFTPSQLDDDFASFYETFYTKHSDTDIAILYWLLADGTVIKPLGRA